MSQLVSFMTFPSINLDSNPYVLQMHCNFFLAIRDNTRMLITIEDTR